MSESKHDVGAVEDFAEDSLTAREVAGHEIVVVRQGDRFYAVPDRCTHAKYPLNDGELLDGRIKCIHHGATFDLETGKPTMPAMKKLRIFDAEVDGDRVVVTLQEA